MQQHLEQQIRRLHVVMQKTHLDHRQIQQIINPVPPRQLKLKTTHQSKIKLPVTKFTVDVAPHVKAEEVAITLSLVSRRRS